MPRILKHGLKFRLPPVNEKRYEIFAEFEVLFAPLLHQRSYLNEQLLSLSNKIK